MDRQRSYDTLRGAKAKKSLKQNYKSQQANTKNH